MKRALLSLLSLVVLVSCHREDVGPATPVTGDIPLQVGNEWVYRVDYYDDNGVVLNTSQFRRTVLKDTLIDKSIWYKLSDGDFVQYNRDGYVYYNKHNQASDRAVIIYPSDFGGSIGYLYKYQNYDLWKLTNRDPQTTTLSTSTGEYSVTTFNIENQYQYPGASAPHIKNQKDYIAPGIGMVRSDTYYFDSENLERRYELVRYIIR